MIEEPDLSYFALASGSSWGHNHHSYKSHPIYQPRLFVKNEFLAVEDISSIDDGKLRYEMFVKAYNETMEHGGINGLTPSEMFLQTFNRSHNSNNTKQKSVTDVGNQNCYLSV